MAGLAVYNSLCSLTSHKRRLYKTPSLTHSQFLSSNSILRLKKQYFSSKVQFRKLSAQKSSFPLVFAAQSNFLKVIQTAWKAGKDGVEAGTNLVPASLDSVPRPIARIAVTFVALTVSLFVLRSFLSTAFFVLGTMGLVYFVFIALNKDDGPRGNNGPKSGGDSGSTEDSLEEARRIMEKYK